ncbi:jg3135, partial [Pararge aegeria aegeria]
GAWAGRRRTRSRAVHSRAPRGKHAAVSSSSVTVAAMLHDAWPAQAHWAHRSENFELDAFINEVNNNCTK